MDENASNFSECSMSQEYCEYWDAPDFCAAVAEIVLALVGVDASEDVTVVIVEPVVFINCSL